MIAAAHEFQTKYDRPGRAENYHQSRYGDWQGKLNLAMTRNALLRALRAVPRGARLLDLPCGSGQYCWSLAAAGFQTLAADASPAMLHVAKTSGPHNPGPSPEFALADIFTLPFADQHFDCALCIRLFNLLNREQRIQALRELARVSRRIIVSYNHPYTFKNISRTLRHRLGLRSKSNDRLSAVEIALEATAANLRVRRTIQVAPFLSEVWLIEMEPSQNKTGGID